MFSDMISNLKQKWVQLSWQIMSTGAEPQTDD